MSFSAYFMFVTLNSETEEVVSCDGPVEATNVHEFGDEIRRGLHRAGSNQLPESVINRLWGVISLVRSASSLSVRVVGDVTVEIRGLTNGEWEEAVQDDL